MLDGSMKGDDSNAPLFQPNFFFSRLNKFDEYNVSSQATAWVKK